jgi:hypothetical protein
MANKVLEDFISTVCEIILEDAFEAKDASELDESEFNQGRRLAYYEVLTTIKNQANFYCIPSSLIKLDKVDLDKDIA